MTDTTAPTAQAPVMTFTIRLQGRGKSAAELVTAFSGSSALSFSSL